MRGSGVTVAVGALERAELVGHGRGLVRVDEAAGPGAFACGCYALLSEDYGKFINNLAAL